MKKQSAYEIWETIKKQIEGQISHKKEVIADYKDKWIVTHNQIHFEENTLTLLENNLQIAKGRLLALPKPEPEE